MTFRLMIEAGALALVCFFAVFILNRLVFHEAPRLLVLGLLMTAGGAGISTMERLWPLLCQAFPTWFAPSFASPAADPVFYVGVAIVAWNIGARHVLAQVEIWKGAPWDGQDRRACD